MRKGVSKGQKVRKGVSALLQLLVVLVVLVLVLVVGVDGAPGPEAACGCLCAAPIALCPARCALRSREGAPGRRTPTWARASISGPNEVSNARWSTKFTCGRHAGRVGGEAKKKNKPCSKARRGEERHAM